MIGLYTSCWSEKGDHILIWKIFVKHHIRDIYNYTAFSARVNRRTIPSIRDIDLALYHQRWFLLFVSPKFDERCKLSSMIDFHLNSASCTILIELLSENCLALKLTIINDWSRFLLPPIDAITLINFNQVLIKWIDRCWLLLI